MAGKPSLHTAQFVMRFTDDDRKRLEALAEERQVSGAEIVRSLIRKEYERTIGKAKR